MLVAGDVALGRRKLLLRRTWRATMVDDVHQSVHVHDPMLATMRVMAIFGSHYRTNTLKSKNSATKTTNRAVLRGTGSSPWDDQLSVMTFTTLDSTNHEVYEDDNNEDVVVDKVPSSMTPSSSSLL